MAGDEFLKTLERLSGRILFVLNLNATLSIFSSGKVPLPVSTIPYCIPQFRQKKGRPKPPFSLSQSVLITRQLLG